MTKLIYNSLKSSDLDIIALSGDERVLDIQATRVEAPGAPPQVLESLVTSVASQINDSRASYAPAFRAIDLHKMITDVIVETSAQGASLLEVHVLDPFWILLRRNQDGWSFIDVGSDGFLWPPIEINFPPDKSDAWWRLASIKPTIDTSQANMTLVFEDKIVAEMREHTAGGTDGLAATDPSLASSTPNETRAEFIERCVKTVGKNTLLPNESKIMFVPLLPGSDFTIADLVSQEVTLPASAQHPASPARQTPLKTPGADNKAVAGGLNRFISSITTILELTTGGINPGGAEGVTGSTGPQPITSFTG